jgi:hypothetical protein
MRIRYPLLVLALSTLAACSSNNASPGTSAPVSTNASSAKIDNSKPSNAEALLTALDAAGSKGFTCRLGDIVIAQQGSGDSWQSFYGSYIDGAQRGLEIVTINMVSYARWIGTPLDDAKPAQVKLIKSLSGAWVTANQPDTILLEELPSTPSRCLEWVSIVADKIDSVRHATTGEWAFQASLEAPNDALITATGATTDTAGAMTSFTVISNGDPVIEIGFELPKEFPAISSNKPTGKTVALTQDQYLELVGS